MMAITAMTSHELAADLLAMPDIEVGTDDGLIVGVHQSTYDTEDKRDVPYINLEVDEN